MAVGPLIGAVKSLSFAPASARDDRWRDLRVRRAMLHNQIGAVGDELRIHAEDGCQRAFPLRRSVIVGLETSNRRIDEHAQHCQVSKKRGTHVGVWRHDAVKQIVAAKRRFWYLLLLLGV